MAKVPGDVVERFHDSFDRVKRNPAFFDVFYERFLASDEIAEKFEGVDVENVKRMVRDALYLKMMAMDGNPVAVRKLQQLGVFHGRFGVKRDHYDLWLDALLSVVEEMDPHYDTKVDASWRSVMARGIDIMKRAAWARA